AEGIDCPDAMARGQNWIRQGRAAVLAERKGPVRVCDRQQYRCRGGDDQQDGEHQPPPPPTPTPQALPPTGAADWPAAPTCRDGPALVQVHAVNGHEQTPVLLGSRIVEAHRVGGQVCHRVLETAPDPLSVSICPVLSGSSR